MTFSIMTFNISNLYANAECHYSESLLCCVTIKSIMLNVVMLKVVLLKVIMLKVILLNVVATI